MSSGQRIGSRAWYSASISGFLTASATSIVGALTEGSSRAGIAVDPAQIEAWHAEIEILKQQLVGVGGLLFLEFSVPRMGRRIDTVLLVGSVIVVIEFKLGAERFERSQT